MEGDIPHKRSTADSPMTPDVRGGHRVRDGLWTPHERRQGQEEDMGAASGMSGAKTAPSKKPVQQAPSVAASPYTSAVGMRGQEDAGVSVRGKMVTGLALEYDETAREARLRSTAAPSVRFGNSGLDECIQAGVRAQGVPVCVEVAGVSGSGKTHALLHMVAMSTLPTTVQNPDIGTVGVCGAKRSVVMFLLGSTSSQVLPSLMTICHSIVTAAWNNTCVLQGRGGLAVPDEWKEQLINQALSRIHIVECFSSFQFLCSVRNLPHLLASAQNVSSIVIDSISAFYWMDKVDHPKIDDSTRMLDASIAMLQRTAAQYKVAIYGSRWMMLESKRTGKGGQPTRQVLGGDSGASKRWKALCTHRLTMSGGGVRGGHGQATHYVQVTRTRDGQTLDTSQVFPITPFFTG